MTRNGIIIADCRKGVLVTSTNGWGVAGDASQLAPSPQHAVSKSERFFDLHTTTLGSTRELSSSIIKISSYF